jgi:hypothetical protein
MASFNLADYETVEERLKRFWADKANADARLVTVNHTTPEDREKGVWVVEARLYLSAADQEKNLPKTTGWAFEIDGVGMANKTSALENAETSSLGRCLANYLYSGNKRASREEMAKVARAEQSKRDWLGEADTLALTYDVDKLRLLYTDAVAAKVSADILEKIKAYGSTAKP